MFVSNMFVGRKHDNSRLPLVLAGGLGGTLETGHVINLLNATDDQRMMCSLYLSLMDRYGVKLDRFGDADTRLEHQRRGLKDVSFRIRPPLKSVI
jgi:hypothetical protein